MFRWCGRNISHIYLRQIKCQILISSGYHSIEFKLGFFSLFQKYFTVYGMWFGENKDSNCVKINIIYCLFASYYNVKCIKLWAFIFAFPASKISDTITILLPGQDPEHSVLLPRLDTFNNILIPNTSAQVFLLGFPVSKSKCWDCSQVSKLTLYASHVALPK
jgi:hypothetical protein